MSVLWKKIYLIKTAFEKLMKWGLKGRFQLMQILGLLGMYFHAVAAEVKKHLSLFKLALAILWEVLFHLPFIIRNFIMKMTFINHFIFMDTNVDIINVNKISGILNIWETFFLHEHQHHHYSPQLFFFLNFGNIFTFQMILLLIR